MKRVCQICGREFEAGFHNRIYCSNACKSAGHLAKVKKNRHFEIRTCAWCGNKFSARTDLKTKCCSLSCAGRLSAKLSPRSYSSREAALARAAAKRAERDAQRKKYGGLTDAQAAEVCRAQDGDPAQLYRLSQGWTDKQRKYAKARYMERHGLKDGLCEFSH